MRSVTLGRTDLRVSAIALGTAAFGGGGVAFDQEAARQVVHRALDVGISLFDAAYVYGFGRAEQVLGDALRTHMRRGEALVATKGGLRGEGRALVRDASAESLRTGVDTSLRNLGVEAIDLYQVHWPDPRTPPEETAAALDDLVREGKIRHVGVSNFGIDEIDALARHGRVESDQPAYSMFRRGVEDGVLPYAAQNDLGVLVYGTLAHGLLSGRVDTGTVFAPGDWRRTDPGFGGDALLKNVAAVQSLRVFGADRGVPLATLAVAWALAHPAVDVAIVGARRPDQLTETIVAADVQLTDDDLARIDRLLADTVPVRGLVLEQL